MVSGWRSRTPTPGSESKTKFRRPCRVCSDSLLEVASFPARRFTSVDVIAGKSVVTFRREAEDETPSAKCFGFV